MTCFCGFISVYMWVWSRLYLLLFVLVSSNTDVWFSVAVPLHAGGGGGQESLPMGSRSSLNWENWALKSFSQPPPPERLCLIRFCLMERREKKPLKQHRYLVKRRLHKHVARKTKTWFYGIDGGFDYKHDSRTWDNNLQMSFKRHIFTRWLMGRITTNESH